MLTVVYISGRFIHMSIRGHLGRAKARPTSTSTTKNKDKDVVMQIRIPADIVAELDAQRTEEERSRHNMIIVVLRRWLWREAQ